MQKPTQGKCSRVSKLQQIQQQYIRQGIPNAVWEARNMLQQEKHPVTKANIVQADYNLQPTGHVGNAGHTGHARHAQINIGNVQNVLYVPSMCYLLLNQNTLLLFVKLIKFVQILKEVKTLKLNKVQRLFCRRKKYNKKGWLMLCRKENVAFQPLFDSEMMINYQFKHSPLQITTKGSNLVRIVKKRLKKVLLKIITTNQIQY